MKNMTPHMNKILKEIKSPKRAAARRAVKIKASLLYHYLHDPDVINRNIDSYDDWIKFLNNYGMMHLDSDQPITSNDQEGSLVVSQPFAEKLAILDSRRLGGAIALILMIETCYEPTLGDPSRLPEVMENHHRLVWFPGFIDTACLHRFLEVDMDVDEWSDKFKLKRPMGKPGSPNFIRAQTLASRPSNLDFISTQEALEAIHKTHTLRSQKIKDCLYSPVPKSHILAEYDPDCLELLFTPPARGIEST